jgi:hypothetical protein
MSDRRSFLYVLTTGSVVFVLLAAILGLNILVDPLWFFGGDKLAPKNFAFDERTARAARFASGAKDYDCYIFGASRVSLMNENRFVDNKCFMFSFAAATPRELVAFAQYAKTFEVREPRLVIVGIDDFDFIDQADTFDVPSFVADKKLPRFWDYYFSARVAGWSVQTLLDRSPLERYYDANLTGQVRADARSFQALHLTLPPGQHWHFSDANVGVYAAFRQVFPNARLVAYVTPIAASRVLAYQHDGILPDYLRAIVDTAKHFDETYDFSIPSAVTTNPTLTYDGSHFYPVVGDQIAAAIQSHDSGFGVRIDGLAADQLQALYAKRIDSLPGLRPQSLHDLGSSAQVHK